MLDQTAELMFQSSRFDDCIRDNFVASFPVFCRFQSIMKMSSALELLLS